MDGLLIKPPHFVLLRILHLRIEKIPTVGSTRLALNRDMSEEIGTNSRVPQGPII